jgi:hypothetical protein
MKKHEYKNILMLITHNNTMLDYQNGKIYELYNIQTGEGFYVGSTAQKYLSNRTTGHRAEATRGKKIKVYEIIRSIGISNFSARLIESYPCNTVYELRKREGEIQKERNYAGNTKIESGCSSKQEYYEKNKEKINEKKKEYYEKNKEHLRDCSDKWLEQNRESYLTYKKRYREDPDNKEKINSARNAWKKRPFTCGCGAIMLNNAKNKHKKSVKHLAWESKEI